MNIIIWLKKFICIKLSLKYLGLLEDDDKYLHEVINEYKEITCALIIRDKFIHFIIKDKAPFYSED